MGGVGVSEGGLPVALGDGLHMDRSSMSVLTEILEARFFLVFLLIGVSSTSGWLIGDVVNPKKRFWLPASSFFTSRLSESFIVSCSNLEDSAPSND